MANRYYSTSDIQIAATLLALGHEMLDTTRSQEQFGKRPRAVLHFVDTEDLRLDVLGYTNDNIQASPRQLFSRLRDLKSSCHNLLS